MADSAAPQVFLFTRGKEGAQLVAGLPEAAPVDALGAAHLHSVVYSADGRLLAALDGGADGGAVVHAVGGAWPLLLRVARPAVSAVAFSPRATFLVTWEKLVDGADGNLLVHRLADGAVVSRLKQKTFARDKWPSTPWTEDETLCAQLATGEVQFYDGAAGPGASPPIARLKLPGVSKFALAPGPARRLATFVPEQKGGPAMVRIYEYPQLEAGAYVRQKAFYKAQSVELKWAPSGVGCLVLAHTDTDASGRSYYGESSLFYVPATKEGAEGNVTRLKEGATARTRHTPHLIPAPPHHTHPGPWLPNCGAAPSPWPAPPGTAGRERPAGFADSPASRREGTI
jgi:translation initiation factor 2A